MMRKSLRRSACATCAVLMFCFPCALSAAEISVTSIRAEHRHGQTFVTWKDVAEGEAGKDYRYVIRRSTGPITDANFDRAELVGRGIVNNSAARFGYAFGESKRIAADVPLAIIEEGGEPLPRWSGLAVHTAVEPGKAYYAVVATDLDGNPVTKVVPRESATTEAVNGEVAPLTPLKLGDGKDRGRYANLTSVTGAKGLPLSVDLHASQGQGGGPHDHGDLYYYFATKKMGYREGLPGYFTVHERRYPTGNRLHLNSRDAIEHPSGKGAGAKETYWFGYYCVPQWADHAEPRAYDFTERRMLWIIDWTIKNYGVDPERVSAGGGSMGAWGSTTFAFRHPEIFAAVYPNRPRTRQRGLPSISDKRLVKDDVPLMFDGQTSFYDRMDMVKFAEEHPGDLPFLGWCCGRRDGFATWQEQIDMVRAMTKARRGFAFAWNDGDHSSGSKPMEQVAKYYPADLFARNQSYPAFANSSIDDDLGNGDPKDGEMEGGINLGFRWSEVVDEPGRWSVKLSNDLCTTTMTVDITPRRLQKFRAKPGQKFSWTNSAGGAGTVAADKNGLVTVENVRIEPGKETTLTIAAP
ncbi:MAG: prolyl oligopeptidase family serine peptidase [Planctomycetales bacterium]